MKFNDQSTIEELIEGCIRKDRLSQKYLYKQLYSSMFAVALRYSKDEDMAAVTDLLMGRKVRILLQGAE